MSSATAMEEDQVVDVTDTAATAADAGVLGEVPEVDETPLDRREVQLVDRLWRSGTSAVGQSRTVGDDFSLVRRLTVDDSRAAFPLLRRHRLSSWRLAAVVCLDVSRAEAATEATWSRIFAEPDGIMANGAHPRAWVLAETRRAALEVGAAPGGTVDVDADITRFPFDHTGDIGHLVASMSLLDEPSRTAVWLQAVEGLPIHDVAHVLRVGDTIEDVEAAQSLVDDAVGSLLVGALRAQQSAGADRCQDALDQFPNYLDHDLDRRAEIDLLTHLRRCRRCAARLDALEAPGLSLVDRVVRPPLALAARLSAAADGA